MSEKMGNNRHDNDPADGIDDILSAARRAPAPGPDTLPPALRARLLDDALAQIPAATVPQTGARSRPDAGQVGLLAGLLDRLGQVLAGGAFGLPGASTIAVAGVAGFWLGFAPPDAAAGLMDYFWQGAATIDPALAEWGTGTDIWAADDALLALVEDL